MKTEREFEAYFVNKGMTKEWASKEFKRRGALGAAGGYKVDNDPDCGLPRVSCFGETRETDFLTNQKIGEVCNGKSGGLHQWRRIRLGNVEGVGLGRGLPKGPGALEMDKKFGWLTPWLGLSSSLNRFRPKVKVGSCTWPQLYRRSREACP
jgi:hypothetical protein